MVTYHTPGYARRAARLQRKKAIRRNSLGVINLFFLIAGPIVFGWVGVLISLKIIGTVTPDHPMLTHPLFLKVPGYSADLDPAGRTQP